MILSSSDRSLTSLLNVASAAGDRQILPQQTNKICMGSLLTVKWLPVQARSFLDLNLDFYDKI